MRVSLVPGLAVAGALVVALSTGCSGAKNTLDGAGDAGGGSTSSGGGSGGSSGSSGSGSGSGGGSGGGSGSGSGSSSGGHSDGGGCPPCDPGNVNLPGSSCDLDCSGTTSPPGPCDGTLTVSGPAADFAKALGICQMATGSSWGLVSATYTTGYDSTAAPTAGQHGILPAFGSAVQPREGTTLGVLSTGYAMVCDDPSATAACTATGTGDPYFKGAQTGMNTANGVAPPGYPKATGTCIPTPTVFDTIGVTLQIKVPKNVAGMSFDFDFYSSDWPEFVCSTYNDEFVAWLQSGAWSGTGGDLNVVLDPAGDVMSVNSSLLGQCTADTPTGCGETAVATGTSTCPAGPAALLGTGFDNPGTYCTNASVGGGATGWLTTTAPVNGGETVTLQLIIWDTGDASWDSSVLVDNLRWYALPQTVRTTPAK